MDVKAKCYCWEELRLHCQLWLCWDTASWPACPGHHTHPNTDSLHQFQLTWVTGRAEIWLIRKWQLRQAETVHAGFGEDEGLWRQISPPPLETGSWNWMAGQGHSQITLWRKGNCTRHKILELVFLSCVLGKFFCKIFFHCQKKVMAADTSQVI